LIFSLDVHENTTTVSIKTKYNIVLFDFSFASLFFSGCRPCLGIQVHPLHETNPFWLPAQQLYRPARASIEAGIHRFRKEVIFNSSHVHSTVEA
jgi:hypothetical protein